MSSYNSLQNKYTFKNPVIDGIPSTFGTSTQVLQVNSTADGLEWGSGGGGTGGTITPEEMILQNATTGYTSTDGTKFYLSGQDCIIDNQESGYALQLKAGGVLRVNIQSDLTAMYSPNLSHVYIEDAFTSLYTPYLRLKSDGAATGCRFTVTSDELYIKNTVASKGIHLMDSLDAERIGFSSTSSKMYSPDGSQSLRIDDNSIIAQGSGVNVYNDTGTSSTAFKTTTGGDGEINTTEAGKNINLNTTNTGKVSISSTAVTTSASTGALVVAGGIASGDGMYCTGPFYNKNGINTDLTSFNQVLGHNSATLPNFSGALYNTLIGTYNSGTLTGQQNFLIGYNSGTSVTSGNYNTSIGVGSMSSNISGDANTCIGGNSGNKNTGHNSVFIGNASGLNFTSGGNNCIIGRNSFNTSDTNAKTSSYMTCLGFSCVLNGTAALTNSTCIGNGSSIDVSNQIKLGNASVTSIAPGGNSVMDLGTASLQFKDARFSGIMYNSNSTATTSNTTGALIVSGGISSGGGMYCTGTFYNKNSINTDLTSYNQVKGHNSATLPTFSGGATGNTLIGGFNTGAITGSYNLSLGCDALQLVTSGGNNTAIGAGSLKLVITGSENVGIGLQAGYITTGTAGTFIGTFSGNKLTSGSGNTCIGRNAGTFPTLGNTAQTSSNLTCLGTSTALADGTVYDRSIAIGYGATITATKQIVIGDATLEATVVSASSSTATNKLKIRVGGTDYYVLLSTS